jgi:hypothetical protein
MHLVVTILLVLALLVPGTARAQSGPGPADTLLDEAAGHIRDGDYESALASFRAAYEREPSWLALSGIAQAHEERGHHLEALEAYERLLREFGDRLSEEQTQVVTRCIAALEARIGVLALDAPPAGTEIMVDGITLGRGPFRDTVRVMPGRHTVVGTLDGHEPITRVVLVIAGGEERLALRLLPKEVQVLVEPAILDTPMPRWLPWVTIGGGLAAIALGGGLEYVAQRNAAAFRDEVAAAAGDTPHQIVIDDRRLRQAKNQEIAAIGLFTAGGVAVVTGVVLVVLNRPRPVGDDSVSRTRLVPTLSGIRLEGSF